MDIDRNADIGTKALRGSLWMTGASGATKLLGLASQIALASFLTKADFAVYAIAISLSVFLSFLRDGGLPTVLSGKGRSFDSYVGPVFWMMLAINGGTGLLIAAMARPAADLYQIPELAGVMTLFAATIPTCVLPAVLGLRLSVDLRLREVSLIQISSAIIRNGLMLLLAAVGYGARSFILPMLISNLAETAMLWLATRCAPWSARPQIRLWPELFRSGRWVLLGTFAGGIGNNGAFFLLGKILPSEILGVYFFAYQIVMQFETIISGNAHQVLFAAFVGMDKDLPRIRAAVQRALSFVVLIGATASLSMAAIFEPLERILWHGKWSTAAPIIYILAFVWPGAACVSVFRALQNATGRFKQFGVITLVSSCVSIAGTVAGAYLGRSAAAAAIGFGIGSLIATILHAKFALGGIHISAQTTSASALRPWLIIAGTAALAHSAGQMAPNVWLDLVFTTICFLSVGIACLRWFAKDSFLLAVHALRRIVQRKAIEQPTVSGAGFP